MKFFLLFIILNSFLFSQNLKKIILTSKNTLVLEGEINEMSAANLSQTALKLANENPTEPFYLVINSNGGSIYSGLNSLMVLNSLSNKIHVIILNAFSMAFVMSQNLSGKRYVVSNSIFMAHKAKGGLNGEFYGNFDTRLKFLKEGLTKIENKISKIMKLNLNNYRNIIDNEFWFDGETAIKYGLADEMAHVKCGEGLTGEHFNIVYYLNLPIKIKKSDCPLITGVLGLEYDEKLAISYNLDIKNMFLINHLDKIFNVK